eukprot:scaffold3031_cov126-Isochrysis_galbana.AAC.3
MKAVSPLAVTCTVDSSSMYAQPPRCACTPTLSRDRPPRDKMLRPRGALNIGGGAAASTPSACPTNPHGPSPAYRSTSSEYLSVSTCSAVPAAHRSGGP